MKEFEKYYEGITLSISSEELCERVMAEADKPKKRFSAKFIGVAAAAAAVMTLGVTAAASGMGYFDVFRDLFGESADNITENVVGGAEVICDTIDIADFELVAAATDKHSVLAIIDITAKNGFSFEDTSNYGVLKNFDWHIEVQPDATGGSAGGGEIIRADENSARIKVYCDYSFDITGSTITIGFNKHIEENSDSILQKIAETGKKWQVRFTAYGESLEYEIDDVKISVSPISVWFESRNKVVGDACLPITIITENDTVTIGSGSKSWQVYADGTYEEQLIYGISNPIDPESVIAIEVQGTRYDLR